MLAEPGIGGEAAALGTNDIFSHLRTQDTIKEMVCQWGVGGQPSQFGDGHWVALLVSSVVARLRGTVTASRMTIRVAQPQPFDETYVIPLHPPP